MTATFRFGRIAGIEVGAHWSWLLVVALVVWSLADGVFPETNPGLSDGAYIAMAVAAALLFFASLLLHELGHAIQARRDGIAIDGITLWVFGGVAQLRSEPPSAGAELRVALAGPAVSLVLGLLFLAAALSLPLPSEVDGVTFWLGYINLTLLIFNLIPALPLDGGRVLRALLWARKRDYVSATRIAGALGRGFGQLLIFGGLALAIFVGDIGGIWLAFVGWFVLAAAEGELQIATARDTLGDLRVADVMVRRPVGVTADTSVQSFMDEVFLATRHTAYPVVDGGRPVGIVTFRHALDLPREAWPVTSVRDIMVTGDDLFIDEDTPLPEALRRLVANGIGRLLVRRADGRLTGLVSLTDVSRVLEVGSHAAPRAERRFGTARRGEAQRVGSASSMP
jgi:Zn-dependent protease/CBS domain-containing protein